MNSIMVLLDNESLVSAGSGRYSGFVSSQLRIIKVRQIKDSHLKQT